MARKNQSPTVGDCPPTVSWSFVRGKHLARFRLADGSRPGLTFAEPNSPQGRARAEEKLAAMFERGLVAKLMDANVAKRDRAAARVGGDPRRVTVGSIADSWVELIESSDLAPATRYGHLAHVENHIRDKWGDREPHSIETGELRAWIRDLHEGKSAARARNVFFTLSKMLEDAIAENWISCANPCRHPKVREALPPIHVPDDDEKARHTEDEAAQLIARTADPTRRLLYLLAFTSGMRYGELAGLTWGDVAPREGILCYSIRKALAKHGDDGPGTLRATKTRASKRHVPVHPAVVTDLAAYRSSTWEAIVGRKATDADFIFADATGAPYRRRAALEFREDLAAAGLPTASPEGYDYVFHSTRGSLATWLEANDCPGDIADRIVGHARHDVRGKHYTKATLGPMLRWLSTIAVVDTAGGHAPAIGGLRADDEIENAKIPIGAIQKAAENRGGGVLTNRTR